MHHRCCCKEEAGKFSDLTTESEGTPQVLQQQANERAEKKGYVGENGIGYKKKNKRNERKKLKGKKHTLFANNLV